MIGIVVVSHGELSKSLINTAEFIVGTQKGIIDVSINVSDSLDEIAKKIEYAINQTNTGDGVLVFTDMLGGSASIASLGFIGKHKIEVLAGFNLPMILEAILHREEFNVHKLAKVIVSKTKKSVVVATLKKRKRTNDCACQGR
jgi:PTS system mannose-specific IIA component